MHPIGRRVLPGGAHSLQVLPGSRRSGGVEDGVVDVGVGHLPLDAKHAPEESGERFDRVFKDGVNRRIRSKTPNLVNTP